MSELHERLRALREEWGLTQAEVAARSGGRLSRAYVALIESGANKGTSAKVRDGYAAAFRLSQDHVTELFEPKPPPVPEPDPRWLAVYASVYSAWMVAEIREHHQLTTEWPSDELLARHREEAEFVATREADAERDARAKEQG